MQHGNPTRTQPPGPPNAQPGPPPPNAQPGPPPPNAQPGVPPPNAQPGPPPPNGQSGPPPPNAQPGPPPPNSQPGPPPPNAQPGPPPPNAQPKFGQQCSSYGVCHHQDIGMHTGLNVTDDTKFQLLMVANNSLLHKAPAIWNSFPQIIREMSTRSKFKRALKRSILATY